MNLAVSIFSGFEGWSLATKILFGIAVFGAAVLVIQVIVTLLGVGGDHDIDAAGGHDIDAAGAHDADAAGAHGAEAAGHDLSGFEGVTFFSFRSVVAFLTFFGWVGFLCLRNGVGAYVAFPAALAAGLAAFVAVALLLHFLFRMATSGNVTAKNAVGAAGAVYLTIPEGKGAAGAVNVTVGQGIHEYSAVSEDGHSIKTGARVMVTGAVNARTLIVRAAEDGTGPEKKV
jgi:hypothetical protein